MSGRPGAAQRVEFRVACCLLWLRACLLSTPPQGPGAQVPGPDGRARIRKNLHPREGRGGQTHSRKWSWGSVMANWQTDS